MKILVSPLEKKYVFEELDQYGVNYTKKEFIIYYCSECNKIYLEKPKTRCLNTVHADTGEAMLCAGEIKSMSLCDIVGSKLNYGIERKKSSDLLHSLENDRIYLQLQSMAEVFKGNAALVFEGTFREVEIKERKRVKLLARQLRQKNQYDRARKILTNCESRLKQMLSIPAHCLSLGIAFIQVDDLKHLIDMLKYFDYKCGEAPKIREKKKSLSKLMPSFVKQLAVTEGIGAKLAARIYQVVKKPEDFINMLKYQPEKLLAVDKLGTGKLGKLKSDWL